MVLQRMQPIFAYNLYAKIVSMIETTNLFDGFATNATYFRVQFVRKDSDKMNLSKKYLQKNAKKLAQIPCILFHSIKYLYIFAVVLTNSLYERH